MSFLYLKKFCFYYCIWFILFFFSFLLLQFRVYLSCECQGCICPCLLKDVFSHQQYGFMPYLGSNPSFGLYFQLVMFKFTHFFKLWNWYMRYKIKEKGIYSVRPSLMLFWWVCLWFFVRPQFCRPLTVGFIHF